MLLHCLGFTVTMIPLGFPLTEKVVTCFCNFFLCNMETHLFNLYSKKGRGKEIKKALNKGHAIL